ncbi:MAG: recombinase family protein [Pseudolabrys sp.]|nr:recombinase family protein [Pseudolabrys sp.]
MSTIHTILRNRLYTGWFEWNGKLIQGKHEALIPVELWERVQGVLDGSFRKKAKRGKHDFVFCLIVAMWLRGGRRDQETALRLLLHGLCR